MRNCLFLTFSAHTNTVATTAALWSRMQFNHQYSHQFRSPQGGNKFGNSLARDPPYSSCHGTLSERHHDGSLSNESDRMKDFITESNQPGMLVLAWNWSTWTFKTLGISCVVPFWVPLKCNDYFFFKFWVRLKMSLFFKNSSSDLL